MVMNEMVEAVLLRIHELKYEEMELGSIQILPIEMMEILMTMMDALLTVQLKQAIYE